jgi:hypothetical protein
MFQGHLAGIFLACAAMFHFANVAMLPPLGESAVQRH